ncbi:transcription initiation factor IIB [Candidatus Bathyarchaeota archaeon]|nr:transcription initiation factor IIB [Candidatus Bathyarchaeota archaeon]
MGKQTGEVVEKCPICGSSNMVEDVSIGETICRGCGYVYQGSMVDRGPEWRAFNLKQRKEKTRTGSPLTNTIHDQGLSTSIGYKNRDHAGRRLKTSQRNRFYRLRKWNRRSKLSNSSHRNLAKALKHISQMGRELSLPRNVVETGAVIYRQILKKERTRGRTIKSLAASSLYIACRICGVSKNIGDIAEAANISKKTAARNYRFLYRLLDRDIPRISTGKIISKLVNQLELSGRVEKVGLDILDPVTELKLTSGKSPSGVASGIIYIGCQITGEKRTQQSIAEKARVTSVTIRNRYQDILEHVDLVIEL